MKKYRYGDPNAAAGWLKRTNVLYFVLAWNALGFCAFSWWKTRKEHENPEWKKLTYAQKYLSLMSDPEDPITVVSMSGIGVQQKKEVKMGEYLKPMPPSVPESSKEASQ